MTPLPPITIEEIVEALGHVRVLDCGAHHCRYCTAGTANKWDHSPSCPYAESQQAYTNSRRLRDHLVSGEYALIRTTARNAHEASAIRLLKLDPPTRAETPK